MSDSDSFVHLHVHSEYSMLDGAARLGDLVAETAAQGMPAVAVTDHGNMFGAFEFWKAAKAGGVKPIIGTEAYITPRTHRSDKTRVRWGDGGGDDVSGAGSYTHMTMFAENTTGMHNLFRLSSKASLEGYYFKPRMDIELLQEYHEGIIATTGCPSGEIQTRLRLGQYDEAVKAAADYRDIFGKENYFAEIMDHGLEIERRIMSDLIRLAKDLGIPLVGTNDLHYTHAHDAKSHAALLCVQSGATLNDPNRFKFDADEFYLKTPQQMRTSSATLPRPATTRCSSPSGATSSSTPPRTTCRSSRCPRARPSTPGSRRRSARASSTATRTASRPRCRSAPTTRSASSTRWASRGTPRGRRLHQLVEEQRHPCRPGRGSGAGSMVAYAMRITDLDPIRHGLIFERFLNPDRVSMPDFDVDFDDRRRGEAIKYVTEKYGSERVAQIVTYGTIKAKQALKDSSRVLGFPFGMGEKLTKAMPPPVMGKDIPLTGIFDKDHPRYKEAVDVRTVVETDPEAKTVFDTALGLEGLKRQWGVHAAGVIMSSDPLIDIIPIMKREQDGQIVTQFDYPAAESLGLIKMDFLGLRNLTIISDALDNIRTNRGIELDLETMGLEDDDAYKLLQRGDTLGVFQLDGGPMRGLLRLMKPDNFEDISALIALYRPGRWVRTRTRTTRSARTASRRSRRSTPSSPSPWPTSWTRPTV